MGLLHLREFQPLHIFSTLVRASYHHGRKQLFRVLMRSNPPVQWDPLPLDRIIPLLPLPRPGAKDGLFCKAVSLFGSFPDYARDFFEVQLPLEEAVIGLQLVHKEKRLFYAQRSSLGENSQRSVDESDLALLDGTFWKDDELIQGQAEPQNRARYGTHSPLG